MIGEGGGDLTNAEGGAEELFTSSSDAGADKVLSRGGAEVLAKAPFEAADGHAGLFCEEGDVDIFAEVLVDLVDEVGNGAVRSGERRAFAVFESSRDTRSAHDLAIFTKKGDFGGHAPFDASAGAGDELELIMERFG